MMRLRPLPQLVLASALVLGLGSGALAQSSGQVYQWKDASGVTHYSQTPPPSGASKYRVFIHGKRDTPQAGQKSAESAQCGIARGNIALLEGGGTVQRDSDGDGRPDQNLSDKERATQLQLARMVLQANCSTPPPAATASTEPPPTPASSESER